MLEEALTERRGTINLDLNVKQDSLILFQPFVRIQGKGRGSLARISDQEF